MPVHSFIKLIKAYIKSALCAALFLISQSSAVLAGSETLNPSGDPSPSNWTLVNSSRNAALADTDDATYIWTGPSAGAAERLEYDDETTIPNDATIDSIVVHVRGKRDVSGDPFTRIECRIRRGATWYCDNDNADDWFPNAVITEFAFPGFVSPPTSAGACSGSWTKTLIDSLDVQFDAVSAAENPRIVKSWIVVYWTDAGSCDYQDPATSSGTNWSNPDSAFLSDDQKAKYANAGQNNMFATNFSIGAPTDATIDSIVVTVEGNGAGNSPGSRAIVVGLTKDGSSEAGDEVSQNMDKNTDNTYTLHGSTNDLWNTTWTAAEINSANFGVTLNKSSTSTDEIRIDHIRVKVCWTEAGESGASGRRRKILLGDTNTENIEYARLDK